MSNNGQGNIRRTVYLVRHGTPETYDGPRAYRGQGDLAIASWGRYEAANTGKWLADQGFNGLIYSSPLSRAKATAEIICSKLMENNPDMKDPDISISEGMIELSVGDWEGLPASEAKEKYPEEYELRGKEMYTRPFPGGESFQEAGIRGKAAIRQILEDNDDNNEDILITAHFCVMGSALVEMGLFDRDELFVTPNPCAGTTIIHQMTDGSLVLDTYGYRSTALLDNEGIETLYDKYHVPEHIRKHMRAVAEYQEILLDKLDYHEPYRDVMRKAALLHDIARLKPHHAAVGAELLRHEGYADIADIVAWHDTPVIKENHSSLPVAPEEIVFYADKRVREDEIVSIADRFLSASLKYPGPEAQASIKAQMDKSLVIEMELSRFIDDLN